jgi:glycosyltransferase involved in cell wall biosynthesis
VLARRISPLQLRLIRYFARDLVGVLSPLSLGYLQRLGCGVALVPRGVDAKTFRPVTPDQRRSLRAQYGLRGDLPVALHVGHLKTGRGVRALADLATRRACQVVLVTSSSTAHEAETGLADQLRCAGVEVLTDYQPHIEHFYQLADCYVFPVRSSDCSIEVPLSVLEALACDLPVVTTPFGGLPELFAHRDHPGFVFVDSSAALVEAALRISRAGVRGTRPLALPYSWETIADGLIRRALDGKARHA